MKTKLIICCLILFSSAHLKAQNSVTIPDPDFVNYLTTNFGACMNGNQLDTTCWQVVDARSLDLREQGPIHNLQGIQFFKKLNFLNCTGIELETLPALPPSLNHLYCDSNKLVSLPKLPSQLGLLRCSYNLLTSLPALPKSLDQVMCNYNQIKELPPFSDSLTILYCDHNQLKSLPELKQLSQLSCSFNQLLKLPDLPVSLNYLECGNNELTTLPKLPPHLTYLHCANNKISCFDIFRTDMKMDISNNPFTCLPNYTGGMDAATLKFPLCKSNDKVNNPNGCAEATWISGNIYKDQNSNCKKDATENDAANIPVKLYDDLNKLVAQTFSDSKGKYYFFITGGRYKVELGNGTFTVNCPYPGTDSVVDVSNGVSVEHVDFSILCKPGFDIGVSGVWASGKVFPGQQHRLAIQAGDLSQWNNLGCSSNVSGTVKATVDGPVTYAGIPLGALTPSVNGNTFTYTISDFSAINQYGFQLLFNTKTTATASDSVCVTINVTPITGDNDPSNNTKHFCYKVFNSYDPNLKEVYPLSDLEEGFKDWFTYTIHFQNTGNAPAIDIALTDTLDPKLDAETFQVLNYSHFNQTTLTGNALYFKFPNIQLVDSISDPEKSKGFIQYRIKPKIGLKVGASVKNRAFIYFDYNKPVITNTTVNTVVKEVSVEKNDWQNKIIVYPNPSDGLYYIELPEKSTMQGVTAEVYNLLGKVVWNGRLTQSNPLDITALPSGIYLLKLTDAEKTYNQRLIKY